MVPTLIRRVTAIALVILMGLMIGAAGTGVIRWEQINSIFRHGTALYGQASDNTGTSAHLSKYNANGSLTDGPGLQGTDSNVLTAGTVAGTGAPLCTDANGGATTTGCAAVSISHVCLIDNDTQSTTALIAAQFSGACEVPKAATITEVDVWGGTGVVGGTLTTTGTSSVNVQKYTPSGGATTTLLSAALATASGQACALTATSGTCGNGNTSSGTVTISTTALSQGDWIQVSAATPDTTQTWYRVAVIYAY